jgi:hypothetical protein
MGTKSSASAARRRATQPATRYRQCALVRQRPDGAEEHYVTWLPVRFAVQGHAVKLRTRGGVWIDGWRVLAVSRAVRTEDQLPDPARFVREHRRPGAA